MRERSHFRTGHGKFHTAILLLPQLPPSLLLPHFHRLRQKQVPPSEQVLQRFQAGRNIIIRIIFLAMVSKSPVAGLAATLTLYSLYYNPVCPDLSTSLNY